MVAACDEKQPVGQLREAICLVARGADSLAKLLFGVGLAKGVVQLGA